MLLIFCKKKWYQLSTFLCGITFFFFFVEEILSLLFYMFTLYEEMLSHRWFSASKLRSFSTAGDKFSFANVTERNFSASAKGSKNILILGYNWSTLL